MKDFSVPVAFYGHGQISLPVIFFALRLSSFDSPVCPLETTFGRSEIPHPPWLGMRPLVQRARETRL